MRPCRVWMRSGRSSLSRRRGRGVPMLAVVNGSARQWEPSQVAMPGGLATPSPGAPDTVAAASRRRGPGEAGWWLRGAAAVLALLAGAAAAVSWQAQYVMVLTGKHAQAVSA